jgi:nucleoside 2-deoxyribosyltransferase
MKIYLAARFDRKDEVRELYNQLIEQGHEITYDWTTHKMIKPYHENQEIAHEYSSNDMEGVKNCDIFILITADGGTGTFIELGAAILSNIKHNKPEIFVIGEHNTKSIFYFHPSVKRKNTVQEVLDEIKKNS